MSRKRVQKTISTPSRTVETDERGTHVQRIIAEYAANGTIPRVTRSKPLYGDFTSSRDLQDQMESYLAAKGNFERLPGKVRRVANNDLVQFVALVEAEDDAGRQALFEAGLEIDGWEPPQAPEVEGNSSPPQPPADSAASPNPADG